MIESAEEFVRLRTSGDHELYLRAATEPAKDRTWLDVIERFPEMRIWVVHNKSVPIEVLKKLAADPSPDIRMAVAMKNSLTPDLFRTLAIDDDRSVRERVAFNKKTPHEVLLTLMNDADDSIANQAKARLLKTGYLWTV